MTYAVVGTLWNVFAIGMTLYFLHDYFKVRTSLIELLLFSTLISAVDPVAVLCVFEEIHVNQLLYICVFGESLLNDAVTIVLYQTFNAMVDAGSLTGADYATAASSFFVVSFGGLLIGLIWAIFTGFTTKHSQHLNVVQPLICLLFPYLAYLTAEMVAMSGILAFVYSCEALIFVYLGISAVSKNHDWDAVFIVSTLISCLVQRFIGVFFLTYLLNIHRVQAIDLVDQFIMSYGGIRGAVCYGLVMSLDPLGGTIKQLVKLLEVKQNEVHKKTVFEMVGENYRQAFNKFAENYVKPYLMSNAKSGADRLVDYHEHIQVKEAVQHLKVHGSFAGLPTAQSKVNLEQATIETSQLVLGNQIYTRNNLEANRLSVLAEMQVKIPRNESISVFLRDKFNELNSPVSTGVYSRHLLDIDNTPRSSSKRQDFQKGNSFDALDSEAYHMTYPYCKNTRTRRQTAYDAANSDQTDKHSRKTTIALHKSSDSDALTFNIDSSKPRFLITSESASPPNAPRFSHRKSSEKDLQEKKLQLEERPRKLSSGLKAFLTKEASEKMTLSPVHEDDENAESSSNERERCS
uniref:Bm2935, isoform f n=1 Tax=Brugia malayi TaxID=6279 RepID=A0A1I9G4W5_BRUMA|nr:Bm2935, isoform f [Brugia malayi]